MPSADVVVVGAGLAGLLAAHELASRGARVVVIAKGLASTVWTAGTIDVAAPPGARTPADGVATLARNPGHPYAALAPDVAPGVADLLGLLERSGVPYEGSLDAEIRPQPTGIGGTRPVGIVPASQAAALPRWGEREALVICGIAGFKDLWATAAAASLSRPDVWARPGTEANAPSRVVGTTADLPDVEDRRNLTAVHLARAFDDPAWRDRAVDAIARAVDRTGIPSDARVGVPAVLGLRDPSGVFDALRRRLGRPVFELPLVPPSVPGLRLHEALRRALRAAGGRIQIGEDVARVGRAGGRVDLVATPAAVREFAVRTSALVLATGGLAGGGLVGRPDGAIDEVVLGLPVAAPPRDEWFARDAFAPAGHPLEAAGIRTDVDLRPVDEAGAAVAENVRIVGSLLAGQRWLRERCGDGVAIASARRAAIGLAAGAVGQPVDLPATADLTRSKVAAAGGPWSPGR